MHAVDVFTTGFMQECIVDLLSDVCARADCAVKYEPRDDVFRDDDDDDTLREADLPDRTLGGETPLAWFRSSLDYSLLQTATTTATSDEIALRFSRTLRDMLALLAASHYKRIVCFLVHDDAERQCFVTYAAVESHGDARADGEAIETATRVLTRATAANEFALSDAGRACDDVLVDEPIDFAVPCVREAA